MKIAAIEAIPVRIPFDIGASPAGFAGAEWAGLSVALVRVETDEGLVGWGEAFSYNCLRAVCAAVEDMVAPLALGRDATDIVGLMRDLHRGLHLWGRYGITMFAISGLDIALWDLAGRAAGVGLARLLGGAAHERLPAYASLFRYGDPELVADRCRAALAEGYGYVKVHEIDEGPIGAARDALGAGVPLMVDANCPWSPVEARMQAERLRAYDLYWLEEPVFPPESYAALASLRFATGVRIATGENACTAHEFERMLAAQAADFVQPSVTKVGGVSEMRAVAALAAARGAAFAPHSPYFGPGFLATVHLAAAQPEAPPLERFHVALEASLYGDLIDPVEGHLRLPEGPGLGPEPDPDVVAEYRVT